MRVWRPFRRRRSLRKYGLYDVDVRGLEHLASAVGQNQGVLITPNHSSHADPFALLEIADRLRTPFYFMTAWQVFAMTHRLGRRVLRDHGCFSINREGYDVRAVRCAVRVLQDRKRPLVIFPEGEVFHLNDHVMPFRRGAATAATLAAERSRRPVACVPCALKFQFVHDPTPNLLALTARLERAMMWTPRPSAPLPRRIHLLIEGILSLQEIAHLGGPQAGGLRDRIVRLMNVVVARLEERFQLVDLAASIPERVKRLRFRAIQRIESATTAEAERERCERDLAHLFLVMQLFSYPVDYLAGDPSLERIAETLDKLEEDVLGVATAGVRGLRHATVMFGEPCLVTPDDRAKGAVEELTSRLQFRVQDLLDELNLGTEPRADAAAEDFVPEPRYDAVPVGA